MTLPLMPKATAVWLVDNTSLTFEQIADFCGLHVLEVKGIADGEVAIGIVGLDPVANGQVTKEEIARCEADPKARLVLKEPVVRLPRRRAKGPRYTPVVRRQDKPDAINWLLKFAPELSDSQISKLIGTTKNTIEAVRERTHWNISNIKPQHPVALGLCGQAELEEAVTTARARLKAREEREAKARARAKAEKAEAAACEAETDEAEAAEDPSTGEAPAAADEPSSNPGMAADPDPAANAEPPVTVNDDLTAAEPEPATHPDR